MAKVEIVCVSFLITFFFNLACMEDFRDINDFINLQTCRGENLCRAQEGALHH